MGMMHFLICPNALHGYFEIDQPIPPVRITVHPRSASAFQAEKMKEKIY
jgi:hypothetical protein